MSSISLSDARVLVTRGAGGVGRAVAATRPRGVDCVTPRIEPMDEKIF